MVQRVIGILIFGAIMALLLNDVGRWFTARQYLDRTTTEVTDWAAQSNAGKTREAGASDTALLAQQKGITVYQYDQNEQRVEVWTNSTVEGTWVAQRLLAALASQPATTPILIDDYAWAAFR